MVIKSDKTLKCTLAGPLNNVHSAIRIRIQLASARSPNLNYVASPNRDLAWSPCSQYCSATADSTAQDVPVDKGKVCFFTVYVAIPAVFCVLWAKKTRKGSAEPGLVHWINSQALIERLEARCRSRICVCFLQRTQFEKRNREEVEGGKGVFRFSTQNEAAVVVRTVLTMFLG